LAFSPPFRHFSFRRRRVCFELEAALRIPSATQMAGPSTLRFNSGRATTGPLFALKEMIKESVFRVKGGPPQADKNDPVVLRRCAGDG